MTATSNPFRLFIPVSPVPASRPRVSKFGTYYTKTYDTHRKALADFLATADGPPVPFTGPVAVLIECVCQSPAKPANDFPKGDVDNLAKGPMDALTKSGKVWADDKLVIVLTVIKRYAKPGEAPGYSISIQEVTT